MLKKMYNLKHLYLILIIFNSFDSLSQEINWQKTIGGNWHDMLTSMEQTTDGGYICGGYSSSDSSYDKSENNIGQFDYWVLKLDAFGNIQWQNTIGGTNRDELKSVHQTADNGYILGGTSDSDISGDKTQSSYGYNDYWIVKLDNNGLIQWDVTIGGDSIDELCSIRQTPDGGYICGGISKSGISGVKSESSYGYFDYWIVKLDSSGNVQWENTIGGSHQEMLSDIVPTQDHGYICGGWSNSDISGDKSENSNGQTDYWILKLDSLSNIVWQNTIGGNYQDNLTSIQPTLDGGYLCGGTSFSMISGDKLEDMQGGADFWLVKIDSLGNILWQNTIGGNLMDQLNFVTENPDRSFLCGGTSTSEISYDKTENCKGGYDFWIHKIDSFGNVIWQNTIGGNKWDGPLTGFAVNDGNFICAGISDSDISVDKIDSCKGGYDFWIINITGRYNLIQGTAFVDLNSNGIREVVEPSLIYKTIKEINTGALAITDNFGFYSLVTQGAGSFQVAPQYFSNYYMPTPSQHNSIFSGINQIDSLNDFAFQSIGVFNDLDITISPVIEMNPGWDAYYNLNYSNVGSSTQNATIIFYPDSNLTFVSSIPSPTILTTDSIVFINNHLVPFQNDQIQIIVNVNQNISIGTLINSSAVILPITNDANPADNESHWQVATTGSFDPNDILVSRNTIFNFEIPSSPYLEYIIRFQNTGTDTATFVRIENKINNRFNLDSFEMICSSHPCNIEFQSYDSIMKFTFNNIQLPDSNANQIESNGFIKYRIKPQTNLIIGDSVLNSARIIFDYNAPVQTNTAVTEIIALTGVDLIVDSRRLEIYPNPFYDRISIKLETNIDQFLKIDLFNVYGQKVKTLFHKKIDTGIWSGNFDLVDLPTGVYFISVLGSKPITKRIIKM